jgi:NTP pyrophosphatase (non-canonical NTP hydrolase)
MNIKELIKDNYAIAKSKGFYPEDSKIEDHLMGIVSELGEAYEAHRNDKFCHLTINAIDYTIQALPVKKSLQKYYREYLSGTFEDEIADVFIRLFNLCGHYDWVLDLELYDWNKYDVVKGLYDCVSDLSNSGDFFLDLCKCGSRLLSICNHNNILIEKHIQAKMQYNKTRKHKHGKEY